MSLCKSQTAFLKIESLIILGFNLFSLESIPRIFIIDILTGHEKEIQVQ